MIHVRLKEELERLGLKPAAAAKAVGEPDSQGLRDILGGRKRLSADLLAALSATGVDVAYVLTGRRADLVLTADERELLALYRSASLTAKMAAVGALQGAMGAAASASAAAKQVIHGSVTGQVAEGGLVNNGSVSIGGKKKDKDR